MRAHFFGLHPAALSGTPQRAEPAPPPAPVPVPTPPLAPVPVPEPVTLLSDPMPVAEPVPPPVVLPVPVVLLPGPPAAVPGVWLPMPAPPVAPFPAPVPAPPPGDVCAIVAPARQNVMAEARRSMRIVGLPRVAPPVSINRLPGSGHERQWCGAVRICLGESAHGLLRRGKRPGVRRLTNVRQKWLGSIG
jgi:hypothetical protein